MKCCRLYQLPALAGVIAAMLALPAFGQQTYPGKPIRIISPNAAGGSADSLARLVAVPLTAAWGQQVVVENKPGASGIIGGEYVAKAPADGHTLEIISMTHLVTPLLMTAPYDAIKNFSAIGSLAGTSLVLTVHPSVSASTLADFIALAKARPDQLNYATAGSGSPAHFATEMFNMLAGVKLRHIPYKGGGPAMTDLIGGQVQVFFTPPVNALPHLKNGRIKAIAVSGDGRLPVLPQVPTTTESGLKGFDVRFWFGLISPAGTPRPVVDKLNAEIGRILALAETREKLASQGMDPFPSSADQFATFLREEQAKFARIVKVASIKLEH